jgi:RNA polymerase sigma factor (sigma-70 family)
LAAVTASGEDPSCLPAPVSDDRLIDRLFRSEAPRLARFLRRSIRNHDEVHDLVQETFASFVAAAPIGMLRSPEAYLRTIARNLLFRRSRRFTAAEAPIYVPVEEALGLSVDPEQEWLMEADDLMRRYEAALSELPSRTREVFRLHRQEELTYHQIADRLGLTARGVKYHMKKALLYLDHVVNSDG